MWKVLFQSVRGPAHETSGQPCQDRCRVLVRATAEGTILAAACADGAGSAALADRGSALACDKVLHLVFNDITEGLSLHKVDRDTAVSWYLRLQPLLEIEAARNNAALPSMATTLLLALIGPECAVFCQVGDGAIVVGESEGFRPVFWPQNGEYANTTNFVTEPSVGETLLFERRDGRVDELALFTDGVQTMALTFAERRAHQPFFLPMFQRLRDSRPGENLARGLRQFLDSGPVRERSDDDKTLILATRVL